MAVTVLNTTYTVEYAGPNDTNLRMDITIARTNSALAGLSDLTIVDFIRDQLAAFVGAPVTIFKIETIKTTE